jgi:hypothetical protein
LQDHAAQGNISRMLPPVSGEEHRAVLRFYSTPSQSLGRF